MHKQTDEFYNSQRVNEYLWSAERNTQKSATLKVEKRKKEGVLERDENTLIKLIALDNEIVLK